MPLMMYVMVECPTE